MKQLSFAIPLSKVVVLADIRRRCVMWGLPTLTHRLLEQWYESGWDDGIAAFDRYELARTLEVEPRELDEGIELLEDLQLIRIRRGFQMKSPSLSPFRARITATARIWAGGRSTFGRSAMSERTPTVVYSPPAYEA